MPAWLPEDLSSTTAPHQVFEAHTYFTRWLFQPLATFGVLRGTVIVGWREAKPCLQSILAVHTGSTDGLRPDMHRPALKQAKDYGWAQATWRMIVLLEPRQRERALNWAAKSAEGSVNILVACSLQQLAEALRIAGEEEVDDTGAAGHTVRSHAPQLPPPQQPRPPWTVGMRSSAAPPQWLPSLPPDPDRHGDIQVFAAPDSKSEPHAGCMQPGFFEGSMELGLQLPPSPKGEWPGGRASAVQHLSHL
eukprot:CAMPEP_0204564804 /NCGR_PEP_ID=MMETSP0661-20131031/35108_1 /ASSEMBLY_ACC=CAM_ASM_000606 /TAXON_ID=109239 /ORGANISM="Alexandrium margalefi, Strain AMGDE01CS-322" /LENGTH=247 /DNA_ID=CAMNT_0051572493 /DNA_START=134 /DNA_END=874 /DNA_ORIENTATION=+